MRSLTSSELAVIENNGWVVECESPLEIRNESEESFASGYAAELVIESILGSQSISYQLSNFSIRFYEMDTVLHSILSLVSQLTFLVDRANFINDSNNWKKVYSEVFSEQCSRTLSELFKKYAVETNQPLFDWYDPDCDYRDDVMAYYSAVKSYVEDNITRFSNKD